MKRARFQESPPRGRVMGMSITTVQRMLGASLVAALGVGYMEGAVMDGMVTFIALCALTAVVWVLSDRESSFSSLNLDGNGPWTMLAMALSIIIFAQVSVAIWAFPTVGAYILSLTFIGSFWLTGMMMQPGGV